VRVGGGQLAEQGVSHRSGARVRLASPWWIVLAASVIAFGDSGGLGFRLAMCDLGVPQEVAAGRAGSSGHDLPPPRSNDPCARALDVAAAVSMAAPPIRSGVRVQASFEARPIDWGLPRDARGLALDGHGRPLLDLALTIPDALGVHLAIVSFGEPGERTKTASLVVLP